MIIVGAVIVVLIGLKHILLPTKTTGHKMYRDEIIHTVTLLQAILVWPVFVCVILLIVV